MEGFVSLEECQDYTLDRDRESDSRVLKINKKKAGKGKKRENEQTKKKKKRKKKKAKTSNETDDRVEDEESKKDDTNETQSTDDKADQDTSDNMCEWTGLGVPSEVIKAISEQGFTQPTAIQALAIPPAIFHHRDIIGAAETGSGKTLAFGIPIIHHILNSTNHKETTSNKSNEESLNDTIEEEDKETTGKPLRALIMTPTRELALQIKDHLVLATKHTSIKHEEHVSDLRNLRYLVIDEADRMIEQGHYEELSSILDHIYLKKNEELFDSCYPDDDKKTKTSLMDKMNMDKKQSKVIDVTTKKGTVETLTEAKITCTKEEK
ncbi:hypothetical protein QZH41_001974 [Actinostola sp. cb2023]|nr:hypothetical protein QZH41_001974 [Actinostola sp. cb2023]